MRDPLSEKRNGHFYVPRDECFSEIKQLTFSPWTYFSPKPPLKEQGIWNTILPRLVKAVTEGSEDVLRFEAPDTMARDKFFWFRDE
ncbi:hypothetical protein CRYUN_Cryun11dG0072800 [Craigia yunnanensis]